MANSSSKQDETKMSDEPKDLAAAAAKADHQKKPSKKDNSDVNSSKEKMGPDIKKDGSMPRW